MLVTHEIIPSFIGGKSQQTINELDRYLEICEAFMENARVGEEVNLVRCFKMRLRGEAHSEIKLANCQSWDELK